MIVCVIRNADADSNSDIIRSIDALTSINIKPILLTRKRVTLSKNTEKKVVNFRNLLIDNYEIHLNSDMDKGLKNLFKLLNYQIKVALWLFKNRKKFDAIHSYDLDTGLPTLFICKFIKKQYIYHISDFFVESRRGIPKKAQRLIKHLEFLVINNAAATIICTEERKSQIIGSNPKQLHVIHNSPVDDISLYKQNDNKNSDIITLSYVGGLIDIRFIKEALECISVNKSFQLNIAGIGPLTDLVTTYSKTYSNIKFLGRVSYEEALQIYKNSDIIFAIYDPTIPNHKFSAPNKVYEAMLLGKPIIVARNTSVDKLVEKENIGMIIDYSKEDFSSLLNCISNNPKILEEFSRAALNSYEKYSWRTMKDRYREIYENLIRG